MKGLRLSLSLTGGSVAPFTMQNRTGTTAVALGGDEWEITKTAATAWGTGSATSVDSFAGDFILRLSPQQIGLHMMVGVTADPLADNAYQTIDYSMYFDATGNTVGQLYENGVAYTLVTPIPFVAGDNFFFKRTGSTMSIGYGGTDGITGYTEMWTRTTSATLYVDSDIHGNGAKVRITKLA